MNKNHFTPIKKGPVERLVDDIFSRLVFTDDTTKLKLVKRISGINFWDDIAIVEAKIQIAIQKKINEKFRKGNFRVKVQLDISDKEVDIYYCELVVKRL